MRPKLSMDLGAFLVVKFDIRPEIDPLPAAPAPPRREEVNKSAIRDKTRMASLETHFAAIPRHFGETAEREVIRFRRIMAQRAER